MHRLKHMSPVGYGFVSDQRLSFNRQECRCAGERKNQEIKVLCLRASSDADALESVESSGLVF